MKGTFAACGKGKVVINRSGLHKRVIVAAASLKECLLFSQYSEKEDKYEEEIKILSDKLKEVSLCSLKLHFGTVLLTASSYLISFFLG